jgi:hypothetical protein
VKGLSLGESGFDTHFVAATLSFYTYKHVLDALEGIETTIAFISPYADGQGPVGVGSTRAEGPMMPGNQVHIFGRRFASAALEPLQDVRESSVAIA